ACRAENALAGADRVSARSNHLDSRAVHEVSVRLLALSSGRQVKRGNGGPGGGRAGPSGGPAGGGGAERAARRRRGSVLGRQALALHVAPELLRHLGRADRRGAEQRLQAVRATAEADRVASKCGLLAGRTLRHLLLLDRKMRALAIHDYHVWWAGPKKTAFPG